MKKYSFICLFLLVLTVFGCKNKIQYSEPPKEIGPFDLFEYLPDGRVEISTEYDPPQYVQKQKIRIRRELLESEDIETIYLNLLDNVTYEVKKEKMVPCDENPNTYVRSICEEGQYIWQGKIITPELPDGYPVDFYVNKERIRAYIRKVSRMTRYLT